MSWCKKIYLCHLLIWSLHLIKLCNLQTPKGLEKRYSKIFKNILKDLNRNLTTILVQNIHLNLLTGRMRVCVCVCVCVSVCVYVCVCVYFHSPWRLHLSGSVGLPGNRSMVLCWRRLFPMPSPLIANLEWRT